MELRRTHSHSFRTGGVNLREGFVAMVKLGISTKAQCNVYFSRGFDDCVRRWFVETLWRVPPG
jgi:hypothetical protein